MDKALKSMIENMPEKTGKSLNEWKQILKEKSFSKHLETVKFLKQEYNVSHGYANTIVALSKDKSETSEELVENQYNGKENLLPIYNKLISEILEFGDDVKVVPKKGSVSLVRKKQFALIKPASKTRIDIGLKLTGMELTNRLENSGPFGTMCTHRVKISNIEEIDYELKSWLIEAYKKAE